mmetsp:Transcript_66253/g.149571  ORF Transcript_66253/g.149571 Transcript_66253/m.149571 type:complete len:515 (-) Transcript_66253:226-1770(-)
MFAAPVWNAWRAPSSSVSAADRASWTLELEARPPCVPESTSSLTRASCWVRSSISCLSFSRTFRFRSRLSASSSTASSALCTASAAASSPRCIAPPSDCIHCSTDPSARRRISASVDSACATKDAAVAAEAPPPPTPPTPPWCTPNRRPWESALSETRLSCPCSCSSRLSACSLSFSALVACIRTLDASSSSDATRSAAWSMGPRNSPMSLSFRRCRTAALTALAAASSRSSMSELTAGPAASMVATTACSSAMTRSTRADASCFPRNASSRRVFAAKMASSALVTLATAASMFRRLLSTLAPEAVSTPCAFFAKLSESFASSSTDWTCRSLPRPSSMAMACKASNLSRPSSSSCRFTLASRSNFSSSAFSLYTWSSTSSTRFSASLTTAWSRWTSRFSTHATEGALVSRDCASRTEERAVSTSPETSPACSPSPISSHSSETWLRRLAAPSSLACSASRIASSCCSCRRCFSSESSARRTASIARWVVKRMSPGPAPLRRSFLALATLFSACE